MNFNHKYGCQKCEVQGEFSKQFRNMSYPCIDATRRTNETFRQRKQPEHHKDVSPFEELINIDMIKAFPISDPLHLLHQGVMKKLLLRWIGKVKGYSRKWSKLIVDSVSKYLLETNKQMPSDIHRSLRSLNDISNWKGVEFRTILMYVGVTALRPVLGDDEYEHFLTLFCACTIVSCSLYKVYTPLAEKMFKSYVEKYISLYGRHSITSNVHNLVHICEDLTGNNIDSINQISTYKYENCLRLLGMKIQSCNRPLEQISRRLIEIQHLNTDLLGNQSSQIDLDPHVEYEVEKNYFSKITIKSDVMLSSRKIGDQWFLTRSGDIVKMKHIIKVSDSYKICGQSLLQKGPFFMKPLDSTRLSVFKSDGKLSCEVCMHEISAVKAKMMRLKFEEEYVYIPILHTLEILNK